MNRTFKLVSAVLAGLLGLSALAACASPAPAPAAPAGSHTISVTGSGLAYGTPDIAVAQIGVQSRNAEPAQAVNDTNAKMTAILAALSELGVEAKDIQTSNFSIYAQQDYDPATNQPQATFTYVADNTVSVTIRDLTKVGEVLSKVVATGANSIYGVSFSVSDPAKLESEARAKAMADAKARAEQLAQIAGVTLEKPLSISEFNNGPQPYAVMDKAAMATGAGSVPVSGGQIQVNLQVNITYEIK